MVLLRNAIRIDRGQFHKEMFFVKISLQFSRVKVRFIHQGEVYCSFQVAFSPYLTKLLNAHLVFVWNKPIAFFSHQNYEG